MNYFMQIINTFKTVLLKNLALRYAAKSLRNIFLPTPFDPVLAKTVAIEVSSICNALCIFCPYRLGYRKKQTIHINDFKKIATSFVNCGFEIGYRKNEYFQQTLFVVYQKQ